MGDEVYGDAGLDFGGGEGEEGFAAEDDGVVDEDCWCAELWEIDLPLVHT